MKQLTVRRTAIVSLMAVTSWMLFWTRRQRASLLLPLHKHQQSRHSSQHVPQEADALLTANMSWPWTDVDWNRRSSCGLQKCFFRSQSQRTTGMGYIITAADIHNALEHLHQAFELDAELHMRFGGPTPLTFEVPQLLNVSTAMVQRLAKHVYQPHSKYYDPQQIKIGSTSNNSTPVNVFGPAVKWGQVVLQRVRVAPEPHLIVGVVNEKIEHTLAELPIFCQVVRRLMTTMQQDNHRHNDTAETVADNFQRTLMSEMERLTAILEAYPSLYVDFHVLLDVHGQMHLIDLDRQFQGSLNNNSSKSNKTIAMSRRRYQRGMTHVLKLIIQGVRDD